MRLYRVSCKRCGWKAQRMIEEQDKGKFEGHRCRVCRGRDPQSQQKFHVEEVIVNLDSKGRG